MANNIFRWACFWVCVSTLYGAQTIDRDALSLQISRSTYTQLHTLYSKTADNELRCALFQPYFNAFYKYLFKPHDHENSAIDCGLDVLIKHTMQDYLLMSWLVESFEYDYAKGQVSYEDLGSCVARHKAHTFFDMPGEENPVTFLGSVLSRRGSLPPPVVPRQDTLLHFLVKTNNFRGLQYALESGQPVDVDDGDNKSLIDCCAWHAVDEKVLNLVHAYSGRRFISVGSWYLQAMIAKNEVTAAYYAKRFALEQMFYKSNAFVYGTLLQQAVLWLKPVYVDQLTALCITQSVDVSQIRNITGYSLLVYAVRKKIDASDEDTHAACAHIVTSLRHAGCDLSFEEYARLRDHAHERGQFARFSEVVASSSSCLKDLDQG